MPGKLSDPRTKISEPPAGFKPTREQIMHIENLDSLAKFSASIIHEVNNPLSGVLIYAQLLRRKIGKGDISKEKILDCLDKIENELSKVTSLVHSLSDFAQQSQLDLSDTAPFEIVDEALASFASILSSKNITLLKELDTCLPKIKVDRPRMCQVLSALISNSVQAMPEGGRLTVRASRKGKFVTLEVEDTGRGIPESNLSKLFIPFFSTRPEVKGVGLGLSAAYGIIQKHAGSMAVESREGRGSVFTLNLPILTA